MKAHDANSACSAVPLRQLLRHSISSSQQTVLHLPAHGNVETLLSEHGLHHHLSQSMVQRTTAVAGPSASQCEDNDQTSISNQMNSRPSN